MARRGLVTEKYIELVPENGQPGAGNPRLIFGSGPPGGDAGDEDDAGLGSVYLDTTGSAWKKIADTNATSDWLEIGDVTIDELHWRNEKVQAATNDTLSAGAGQDPTSWTDNDSGVDATNWLVGQYVLGDVNGTPALWEITAKASATSITLAAASLPLANNDTFIVQSYLPDPGATQESQAIIHFPLASGAGIKISDFNWNLADGITLNGYSESQGPIAGTDTVQVAIEKTGGDVTDLVTLSGVARGSTVLGAFAATASVLFAATYTVKSALQRAGDLLAQLRGVAANAVTTAAALDAVPHASVQCVKWLVKLQEDATPENKSAFEILALTDGTNVDWNMDKILKLGSNFDYTVNVAINGANLELQISDDGGGAISGIARRIEVVQSVL